MSNLRSRDLGSAFKYQPLIEVREGAVPAPVVGRYVFDQGQGVNALLREVDARFLFDLPDTLSFAFNLIFFDDLFAISLILEGHYASWNSEIAPAIAGLFASWVDEYPVRRLAVGFLLPHEVASASCCPFLAQCVAVGVESWYITGRQGG